MVSVAKMHGAGNDFVVVAQPPPPVPRDSEWVRRLADRRRGVGGDGVLFLEQADHPGAALRMHFYNCDGGRAGLCLNGARCVALRAVQLGWTTDRFGILTEHGRLEAEVDRSTGEVSLWIPALRPAGDAVLLPDGSPGPRGLPVHTGDPHLVVEVAPTVVARADFADLARPLRWWRGDGTFAEGNNVHFVSRDGNDWTIRSFERGVEGETLACGSGCVSAVAALGGPAEDEISLHVRSGDVLRVHRERERWRLSGPAVLVFTCEVSAPGSPESDLAPA